MSVDVRVAFPAGGRSALIRITGVLSGHDVAAVRAAFASLLSRHPERVTVDVRACAFADAAGLTLQAWLARRGRDVGIPTILRGFAHGEEAFFRRFGLSQASETVAPV